MNIEHPQHILAIANAYFEFHNADNCNRKPSDFGIGLSTFPMDAFIDEASSHLFMGQLSRLEKDIEYRQIIPYMTFTSQSNDGVRRYIPHLRTKRISETELQGKVSIGFSGHIDAKDVVYHEHSVIDLEYTLRYAGKREKLKQIIPVEDRYFNGFQTEPVVFTNQFLRLDLTPIDAVRIGIVMTTTFPDHVAFRANDPELELWTPMTCEELLDGANRGDYELENWTRVILEAEQCKNNRLKLEIKNKEKEMNALVKKKYPQFILAIENEYFKNRRTDFGAFTVSNQSFCQGVSQYPYDVFLKEVQSHLGIMERHVLENNQNWRQILPYIIVSQYDAENNLKYSVYRRVAGTGESRLAGNVSIGYGGHIDFADIVSNLDSVIDLRKTIKESIYREADEEFEILNDLGEKQSIDLFSSNDFILDDTNDVGKHHVGVVCRIELPSHFVLKTKEKDQLTQMPMMTGPELLTSGLPLENWTRIYLEHVHQ